MPTAATAPGVPTEEEAAEFQAYCDLVKGPLEMGDAWLEVPENREKLLQAFRRTQAAVKARMTEAARTAAEQGYATAKREQAEEKAKDAAEAAAKNAATEKAAAEEKATADAAEAAATKAATEKAAADQAKATAAAKEAADKAATETAAAEKAEAEKEAEAARARAATEEKGGKAPEYDLTRDDPRGEQVGASVNLLLIQSLEGITKRLEQLETKRPTRQDEGYGGHDLGTGPRGRLTERKGFQPENPRVRRQGGSV